MSDISERDLSEADRAHLRAQRAQSRAATTYKAFLRKLREKGSLSEVVAEQAAVSALCALEQRLMGPEGRQLEAQLPSTLQILLEGCERHEGTPERKFGRDEVLARVAHDLAMPEGDVEPIVRAVFATVAESVSAGEVEQVIGQLPSDLRALWPPLELLAERVQEEKRQGRARAGGRRRSTGAVGKNIEKAISALSSLPMAAQLGVLRTVVPKVVLQLDPMARQAFLRTLDEEIDRGERGRQTYEITHHAPPPS